VYAVADESDEPDDLDGFNTDDESPAQGSSQTQMHAFGQFANLSGTSSLTIRSVSDETFYGHPADLHTPDKPSCANTQSRSGSRDRSSLTPSRATPRAAAREVVSTGHVEGTEARSSTPDGTSTRISNASDGWLDFIEPKSRRRRFPDASAFPSAPGSFTSTPASSPVRGQGRRAITDSPSKPHSVAPSAETIAAQSFVDEIRRLGRSAVDSIRLMDESGKAHSEYMAAAAAYKVSKTSANRAAKNTAKMVYDVIKEEYAEAMTAVPGQWTALKQAEDAWACARRGITRAALEQEGAPSDDESVSVPMGEHLLCGPMAYLPLVSGTSTSTSRSGSDSGSGAKRKAAFSHAEGMSVSGFILLFAELRTQIASQLQRSRDGNYPRPRRPARLHHRIKGTLVSSTSLRTTRRVFLQRPRSRHSRGH